MKKRFCFVNLFVIFFIIFNNFGCLIYHAVDEYYSMTFSNESNSYVSDWYVKSSGGDNYVKYIGSFYPVSSYTKKKIYNLPRGYYTVYFSLKREPQYNDYYKSSGEIYLNRDKIYHFRGFDYVSDEFSRKKRGAENVAEQNKNKLRLEDEQGNVIEFAKVSETEKN